MADQTSNIVDQIQIYIIEEIYSIVSNRVSIKG
jgi:hypothetical protein